MKKFLFFAVIAGLTLSGCEQNTEPPTPPAGDEPEIDLGSLQNLSVSADECNETIEYQIVNPVENGSISAKSQESWIDDFNYDTPNQISFHIYGNTGIEARESTVTITYTYGEGLTVEVQFNVVQEAAAVTQDYDYEYELTLLTGTYYGSDYGLNGEYNYYTWFSDMPFEDGYPVYGGTYYLFDLFSATAPEDSSNPMPPAGTYVLGELGQTADMTFTPDYSTALSSTAEGDVVFEVDFAEGTLTISYSGSTMTAEAFLTDDNGQTHHITYTGEADYTGGGNTSFSTLTGDYTLDLNGAVGSAEFYGDYFGTGGGNWYISIMPTSGNDGFTADLVVESLNFSDGPEGTFTAAAVYPYPNEYMQGYMSDGYLGGTMYLGGFDAYGSVSQYAPATSGDLVITGNNDGTYTLSFEFNDDAGNVWDGEWTGSLSMTDESAGYAPAKSHPNIPYRTENSLTSNDGARKYLKKR